ncbi:hypothetical protein [Sporosarcina obsidiansis]|uniref:hypothetical protein n=1 Tax=Sporosarcina obsidiansis TaxID=2660748 RepID=UPI00129A71DF|nr:hypothetical protein [Sporosarcina obsidiansis]
MNNSSEYVIQTLSYVSIERVVDRLEQTFHTSFHSISLFQDRITTSKQTFYIEHVWDVSYRPFSGRNGLFYLHTNEGVFTFEVVEEPQPFIDAFKELRNTPMNL